MTAGTVLTNAGALAGMAARAAARADAEGHLSPQVLEAVVAAGFPRHFVAGRWGGGDGTFGELTRSVTALGACCPSTAWFASLAATLGRMTGYLPEEGQRLVWGGGPDSVVVGSLLPLGTAVAVDDGWRVDGSWPYVSFVEHSDWALVLARAAQELRFFALPRHAYGITPTWSSVGMRATASHTLTVEAACVPPELSYPRAHLDRGTPVASGSACHQVPLEGVSGLTFVAPILGAARGTLNAWIALARRRRSRAGTAVTLSASHDLVLSRAAAEVEAASLLVTAVADRADAGARTSLHEVTGARDCAFAAELLVAATDRVVAGAGTAGLSTDHALERLWRDVHSAASHIMLQPARAAGAYARVVLD